MSCESHYRDLLGLPQPSISFDEKMPNAEVIMMKVANFTFLIASIISSQRSIETTTQERECVMCEVLDQACRGQLPQAGITVPPKSIVMVVGQAHIEGAPNLGPRLIDLRVDAPRTRPAPFVGGSEVGGCDARH